MYRPRRWFNEIPAITLLVLVFGATMHFSAVISKSMGSNGTTLAPSQSVAPIVNSSPQQTSRSARPVAQLLPPPDGLQSVEFSLDYPVSGQENSGGAYRSATGHYTINGHSVLVTTLYADADGSSLGTRQIRLADGTEAWATPAVGRSSPNQIALARDGLLITLSSDLSLDDLATLATRVTVRW